MIPNVSKRMFRAPRAEMESMTHAEMLERVEAKSITCVECVRE